MGYGSLNYCYFFGYKGSIRSLNVLDTTKYYKDETNRARNKEFQCQPIKTESGKRHSGIQSPSETICWVKIKTRHFYVNSISLDATNTSFDDMVLFIKIRLFLARIIPRASLIRIPLVQGFKRIWPIWSASCSIININLLKHIHEPEHGSWIISSPWALF